MNKKLIISVIVAVIVAGGLGFYIGMNYGAGSATASRTGASAFAGRFGGATGTTRTGGGVVAGSIISESTDSITIQLASGNSEVVFVSTSTPIMKSTSGSMSDLTTGENVMVTGTTNSDGSVTAQSIQIRPAGSGTGFGGGFGASSTVQVQ